MAVLVGKKAPDFKVPAVVKGGEIVQDFTLSQFLGKHVILFFYPKDFTFVCPTELHAFETASEDFKERNVQIIGVSTDTEQSHWAWLQLGREQGGIKGVSYPLVADTNKTISYNYDVLAGSWDYDDEGNLLAEGDLIAYRGLFLIDKEGIVRHQLVNDLPLGRNVEEALRMVDSLQFFEENGEVCPANWSRGKEGLKANHVGVAEYLAKH